jgi:hypothetical protein
MSDTVAVALISALPTAAVALAALLGNFLLEGRRHEHDQSQAARQFEHDRQMRILEWRRADRLERLAPVRDFLDGLSREALVLTAVSENLDGDYVERLTAFLRNHGGAIVHISDPTLRDAVVGVMAAFQVALEKRSMTDKERDAWQAAARRGWDRLEELQSAL